MKHFVYQIVLVLLALTAVANPVSGAVLGHGSRSLNRSPKTTQTGSPAASANSTKELDDSRQRIFTLLVKHTFDPQTRGHAELYYKTRFFAAHLQARMRYIQSQHKLTMDTATPSTDESEQMGLTQAEADDLNSTMRE
ncbi:hypothetical protein EV175_007143, partial [Coemansia sp. RSA 1933]